MSVLEYLEVKIIENCNYRCSGCAGWGNIAQREVYDIEQYEEDIRIVQSCENASYTWWRALVK